MTVPDELWRLPDLPLGAVAEPIPITPSEEGDQRERVFVDANEFAESEIDAPEPLWGDDQVNAIPAGGLVLLAGRPGAGKTTVIVDLACHLACGLSWPPVDPENTRAPASFRAPRPLRVAVVENEGPQEMFRQKIKEKLDVFPHRIPHPDENTGCLVIQTWRWGAFSFADRDAGESARRELDQLDVDVVFGDPLASLGPEGVGSPADTRDFVALLRPLGLGQRRAFVFLHHFRERAERTEDELARISGAWGGHLDTLLTLSATTSEDRARLAWPKLRWARRKKPAPIILEKVWRTASFEAVSEEGDVSALEPVVAAALAESREQNSKRHGWLTAIELGKVTHNRRVDVQKALEGAPHLFSLRAGADAKAIGGHVNSKLWGLAEWDDAVQQPLRDVDEATGALSIDEEIDLDLGL